MLENVKSGLEGQQFLITGEENLSKGLENNKKVFGEKWNTIGFKDATSVHFCSLVFNQEVFNLNMDWSILCPFKLVVYNMKARPDQIFILTARPTYLLKDDAHKKAPEIGKKMEDRIIRAVMEGALAACPASGGRPARGQGPCSARSAVTRARPAVTLARRA